MASFASGPNLRFVGFCGADDSVQPEFLQLLSIHYPWIEWGVLFRPDLEGQPRYASAEWVEKLSSVNKETGHLMRLAGHLCQSRCQEVIDGDSSFVRELYDKGFGRVQVNATALNGVIVDKSRTSDYVTNLRTCILSVPEIEWILQYNDETKHIVDPIMTGESPPTNMSVLFDASCGTGALASSYRAPIKGIKCGYAGGIGPATIEDVIKKVAAAAGDTPVWIDMESSLRLQVRGVPDKDVFSLDKCFACALVAVQAGLPVSRFTLLTI
jgi:hypothetical protein